MFDKRLRAGVERGLKPVGTGLRRAGIKADQLTAAGLVISVASAVAIGSGRLFLGMVLLGLSAVPDLLDGAVAKASGTASPRGAFFDSVADRVSDMLVLGGVAWYLASVDGGHAAILPLAVLAASSLVSYERARAESLGFTARGGLMERAERMIAIAAGLIFSAVLVPILWVMLALTLFTAGHRFLMVWRQANAPRRLNRPPSAWGTGRWRGWTPSVSFGTTAARRERQPGGTCRGGAPHGKRAWRRFPHRQRQRTDGPRTGARAAGHQDHHRSVGGRSRGLAPPGPQPAVTEPAPPRSRWRRRSPYLLYRAASLVANALPERIAVPLASRGGMVAASFMGARSVVVGRNQQRIAVEPLDASTTERRVRGAFASYGRYWMESFRLPSLDPARLAEQFSIEGLGHIEAARAAGKGAILAIPHLGGWEVGGAWFVRRGFPLTVVVEPVEPPELFDWFVRLREGFGFKVIPLGPRAGMAVVRALRANQVVALLADRDIGGGGVDVEFFGETTKLPGGPATLARRMGAHRCSPRRSTSTGGVTTPSSAHRCRWKEAWRT